MQKSAGRECAWNVTGLFQDGWGSVQWMKCRGVGPRKLPLEGSRGHGSPLAGCQRRRSASGAGATRSSGVGPGAGEGAPAGPAVSTVRMQVGALSLASHQHEGMLAWEPPASQAGQRRQPRMRPARVPPAALDGIHSQPQSSDSLGDSLISSSGVSHSSLHRSTAWPSRLHPTAELQIWSSNGRSAAAGGVGR